MCCRAIYPFAAVHGGIGTSGPKNLILLSTVPAYLCLLGLLGSVLRHVL
jgi:hypothetical protein